MNDRELLELAAKAAGIGPVIGFAAEAGELMIGPRSNIRYWNPLADDGAALRLAGTLQMLISIEDCYTRVHFDISAQQFSVMHGDDQPSATRRAIVLCAAHLGSKMP